jgi:hypothetical protein
VSIPPAWHPDPTGKHDHRWWDGERWTEHVADAGQASIDPLEGAPAAGSAGAAEHTTTEATSGATPDTGAADASDVGPDTADQPAEGPTTPQEDAGGQGWPASGEPAGQDASGGPMAASDAPQQDWGAAPGGETPQQDWGATPAGGTPQQDWGASAGGAPGAQGPTPGHEGAGWAQQGSSGGGEWGGQAPSWPQAGQGAPQWSAGPEPATTGKTSGLAITALIVGLVGICIPFLGPVAAVVLGILALRQVSRRASRGRGLAIAGLVLGAVFLVVHLLILPPFFRAVGTYVDCMQRFDDETLCQRELEDTMFGR